MKRFALPSLALAAGLLIGACEESYTPTDVQLAPVFANGNSPKGGGGSNTADTDSRAVWTWYAALSSTRTDGLASAATGIYGDGRDKTGETLSSTEDITGEYQGELCGVHAKIFSNDPDYSQSGDAVFDPDMNSSGSCTPRTAYLHPMELTDPVAAGFFTNARQVMQLESGSRQQRMNFNSNGLPNCERLIFGEPVDPNTVTATTGGVIVSRTASDDPATTSVEPSAWTVETVDGVGKCYNWRKGSYQHDPKKDPTYTGLHFSITITEVPYPYPTS